MANYRYYIIAVLATLAMFLLFAEPDAGFNNAMWTIVFIGTKGIAFGLFYVASTLTKYWTRKNEMKSFDEIFKED